MLIAIFISLFSFGQTLDQSSESSSGFDSGANAANPQGQSFTAGVTGNLSQISLRLGNNGNFTPGDFQLTIYNGNGYAGAVLNTTTLNISSTSSGLTEEFAIVLSSPVSITAGNMYTFDFRGLGSASINFRLNFSNYGPGGYYFASGNTGLYNTYDIWFKTFVSPPASPATHLNFDGVNDRVELPNESLYDFTTAMTVEVWMNSNVMPEQWDPLITKGDNSWRLHLNNTGTVDFTCSGTSGVGAVSTTSITDGNWHHVAGVYDGTSIKIYIDGVLENQVLATGSIVNSNFPVFIGNNSDYTVRFYTGNIDEVRIWNIARTINQINGSRNCELQGNETGLVSYYNFNQGNDASNNSTETILLDSSSNGNNGTLNNFALNGATSNWLAGSPVITGSIVPSNALVTTPIVYDQGDSASALTATIGTNGTGLVWYTSATGGTGSTTAPTPSTATVGTTSYWVSSTNANGCESERVEIVVTVNSVTPATHLDFDGVNDYVSANNNLLPFGNSARTVEAWVKTSTSNVGTIVNYGNQSTNQRFGVLLDGSGRVLVIGEFNDYTTTTSINDNNWHHVAVTFDGNLLTVYVDGVNVGTTNKTYATNGDLMGIGSTYRTTFWGELLDGEIDEVRIWNIARAQSDIQDNMNCELEGTETGLVSYYKFNQGNDASNNSTETILLDSSSNGNNGTLNNFALNGATSNWLAGSPVVSGSIMPSNPGVTTPVVYNQGDTATPLTATVGANGTDLLWYTSATGGTGSTTAPTPSTSTAGNMSYWVSSVNTNGCESERVEIVVTVIASISGCWKNIYTGVNQTYAIANDGTLWAWGFNAEAQLGLGDTSNRLVPTQIGTATNWKTLSSGDRHVLALREDGTLWVWGRNTQGHLGLGDTSQRNVPTQLGTATDWDKIDCGSNTSLAIKTDGTLWVWGGNNEGQLGLGDLTQRLVPTQIGTDTDWIAINGAGQSTYAIKSNGTLWGTGANADGQLGLGDNIQRLSFVQIGTDTNWSKVQVGLGAFALAQKIDGSLWGTGNNQFGQLGQNNTANLNEFTQIGTATDWYKFISANSHSMAIKSDGTLYTWGRNNSGQLGLGDNSNRLVPTQVGTATNWYDVDGGEGFLIALNIVGEIWSTGNNWAGQLGLGDFTNRNSPVQIACPCTSTTVWSGSSWSNGFPDETKQVVFNGNYTGIGFSACSLQVNGTAEVIINSNETLHVQGTVIVAATANLEFQNNAYLVQVSNIPNIGNVKMIRDSAPIIRLDYTAWSSPVANQNLLGFSPLTLTNRFYTYDPSGTTTASAWISVADPSTTIFTPGKGYLIRAANNWNATLASPFSGLFEGVPNNGDITIPVTVGYNLLGNPYPSPIDNLQFISENQDVGVNVLYYWTHTVPASGGVYPLNNYASYTIAGGVAAAAGGLQPDGLTQVGQGFITNINSVGNVEFKNSLRQVESFGQFFRTVNTIERHRLWLNLSDDTKDYNQMMIAYMTGATIGFDQGIDGELFTNSSTHLSSIFDNKKYVIQGRSENFVDSDEVALSFTVNQDGDYRISLDSFDGLFVNQDIFIWDKILNIRFNIKQADYIFNATAGTYNDRFSVVYTNNSVLSSDNIDLENNLKVFIDGTNQIQIQNMKIELSKVEIFDISGRQLFTQNEINANQFSIANTFGNQVLLVRVANENGSVFTKKILK
ncbi:hypothetical protein KK2020170_04850 [Flavobacterium okayamense]|uniref:LamG-like jellyroll fold domain-containing protein n=1 Tax=Flavobacterium okayamense TaxID=2830782 RepID=A0ABN6HXN8_9FLAO|nr:hypothetical protein KK2020170_04850 [Flavobacterium okayamense]